MFITFEGIDGCGKSTQVKRLAQHLPNALTTREPGGTELGEAIRDVLLRPRTQDWDIKTELLLFTAARRDHTQRVIHPACACGRTVICDRYVDSTRAYQSAPEVREMIEHLHQTFVGLEADITFWIDTPAEVAFTRMSQRTTAPDRFDQKGLDFQRHLRTQFARVAQDFPTRIKRIDGNQPEESVFTQILEYL